MGHYKSNVRDLEFNLFETLGLEQALAGGAFGDLDGDSVRQMLSEASRLDPWPNRSPTATGTHRHSTRTHMS